MLDEAADREDVPEIELGDAEVVLEGADREEEPDIELRDAEDVPDEVTD